MKKFTVILLLALSIFTLTACEEEVTCTDGQVLNDKGVCEDVAPDTYTVTFATDGGTEVAIQTVESGNLASEPTAPTKDGYEFSVWYTTDNSVAYDFTTPITADITLNAYWLELYTVTFNVNEGSTVANQTVASGKTVTEPSVPTKEGYTFARWYTTDDSISFDFDSPVTADVTLNAFWIKDVTAEELVEQDVQYFIENIMKNDYQADFAKRGKVNRSYITWTNETEHVLANGLVVPLRKGETAIVEQVTATFTLNGATKTHTFDITILPQEDVVLAETRNVPFENLTTEYDIEDGTLDLVYEDGGAVPYVELSDFFTLLDGFIDPEVTITKTTNEDGNTMYAYVYTDEDEVDWDLEITLDADENTITVNDPAFYWAYIYSVETNYGRHIEYQDENYPGYDYVEGEDIVYDLDDYDMDIPEYEGEVYLPYYIANQLFAGSSYYNVYYNYDGLYGIYAIPGSSSEEVETIRDSSKSQTNIPVDMVIHNFNMLVFNMDTFYGLKDINEVDTYYTDLMARKEGFFSQNIKNIEEELFDFIYKGLDDPHTSYRLSSFYNSKTATGPILNSLSQLGDRQVSMYEYATYGYWAVSSAREGKWGTDPETEMDLTPTYWFVDDVTAVITYDGFNTVDMEVSMGAYDKAFVEEVLEVEDADTVIPQVAQGSKFWYYKSSSLDNNILELLVRDVDAAYLETYKTALVESGATLVTDSENTEEGKENGYYSKTVGEITYMIQVAYDAEYKIFYVAVVDEVPETYDADWLFFVDVEYSILSDSAVYIEMVLAQIEEEQPLVENIILDLTYNGGGNVGALYRVLGFMTDDPFPVSKIDRDTGSFSTSYVGIDDGIPSYAHLNWSLLTSTPTYSAANELVAIFITEDLGEVIGKTTGGGACSITPVLLPSGTALTMSSNNIGATRTGSGTVEDPYVYHNTEFGFDPTIDIDFNLIYDEDTLSGIVNPE